MRTEPDGGQAGEPQHRPPPGLAAIVLAGGDSSRFGSDKLAASYRGRPLLWHALAAVETVANESILALASDAPIPALPPAGRAPAIVRDAFPDAGPLVGLLAGLRSTPAAVAVLIGADMPLVRADVLRLLAGRIVADERIAAAALLEGGRLRPLPCALRVEPARVAAERLVAAGERSLRSLLRALGATAVDEIEWRALDPDALSLRDVDTPLDLARLDRGSSRGPC